MFASVTKESEALMGTTPQPPPVFETTRTHLDSDDDVSPPETSAKIGRWNVHEAQSMVNSARRTVSKRKFSHKVC